MSDFVIVGAGSAGCILANRLSVDPSVQVTLLEAGGSDGNFLYRMPAGFFGLMKSGMGNWGYDTVPQPGLNERALFYPRGKVLGGSSSINGLAHVRGNAGDFDQWAQAGNEGWGYRDCLPFFRKMEDFAGGEGEYRGVGGPIGVTMPPPLEEMSPVYQALMAAAIEAGYYHNPDYNGASQEGFARINATIANACRQSTSSTYLAAALARPNLKVITHAHVTRLCIRGGKVVGVEYRHKGRLQTIETDGEILLAGGAVNSPQLLQLSGIGPAALLRRFNIPVIYDLPGVGENLHDHLTVPVMQELTKPYSALTHLHPVRAALSLLQYFLFKSGPTTTSGQDLTAFVKTRPDLDYPDVQFHFPLLLFEDNGRKVIKRHGFAIFVNGARPLSRGRVRIASADPVAAPLIDPNYLAHPHDAVVLRAALRLARTVIAQPALDELRGPEYAPGIDAQSDSDLDRYIRATASSVYHPVGTCKMGSDPMAVVDSRLKVHGVDGLRVIDASVMPSIVSGNTNAATMMIAEKAADFIIGGGSSVASVADAVA